MKFLIRDLLDFAQIKNGKFRKNLKDFDVLKAVNKVMTIQREKADSLGIKFECESFMENPIVF